MSSDNTKKKRKRTSPFRIKVGCLVALRFRPRENRIRLESPDGKLVVCVGETKDGQNGYQEPVTSAHFSEVWTDPAPGRDDGLALIGSRIRCVFPKSILSKPYNATSRFLQGEVVAVINYFEDQYEKRKRRLRWDRTSKGLLVDLLVENKDNKTAKNFPFLQRVDEVVGKEEIARMSDSERRGYKNEERIKGGPDKAIFRVLLDDQSSLGIPLEQKTTTKQPRAKWVIRKRVPTKITRQSSEVRKPISIPNGTTQESESGTRSDSIQIGEVHESVSPNTSNDGQLIQENQGEETKEIESPVKDGIKEPPAKKQRGIMFNKEFSSSRFIGDRNDSNDQQESNWRWQAAKYDPFSVLTDRPISKGLLDKLCYNFVGEVLRVEPETSQSATTLATVTIRCLVLPEHTIKGRLSHHQQQEVFENQELTLDSLGMRYSRSEDARSSVDVQSQLEETDNTHKTCLLKVPIEELLVVHRKVRRITTESKNPVETSALDASTQDMIVRYSYSHLNDTYSPLGTERDLEGQGGTNGEIKARWCHRCRRQSFSGTEIPQFICTSCIESLAGMERNGGKAQMNKRKLLCDCNGCVRDQNVQKLANLSNEVVRSISKLGKTLQELGDYALQDDSGFISTRFVAKGMAVVDFAYNPLSVNPLLAQSSSKLVSKVVERVPRKNKRTKAINIATQENVSSSGPEGATFAGRGTPKQEVFRPTSARLLTYDATNRRFDASATDLYQWKLAHLSSMSTEYPELPRNLRLEANPHFEEASESTTTGRKTLGRAARANQRRLVRSIAAMGVNVDTLSGREQQLRFDRSGIHDWGVFVDIDVSEGEMIVEYRGEVIGNAMAEKREKEYHEAKLGSDYMFRIDELAVCDATKHGNVARFINASCDPNCYTKIISLDGTKRIVIYAKRDIKSGEELCYDYKFAFEPDPDKRIPCRCGAQECRGFLNWDKRNPEIVVDATGNKIARTKTPDEAPEAKERMYGESGIAVSDITIK